VLYRPPTVTTDLGLYGSSHVGMLGGMVKPTNIKGILQWDLLKTDFFHAESDPAFLYYNPYDTNRKIKLHVGPAPKDILDKVGNAMLARTVHGSVEISIPPDTARVIIIRQPETQ
jgi:hypothetical protein